MNLPSLVLLLVPAVLAGQMVETVAVVEKTLDRTSRLPAEIAPYQSVDVHARVAGYVEKVEVDVGSAVNAGDLLVTLSAPEMQIEVAEAEARLEAIRAQRVEAEARLVAAQSTFERLSEAAKTPGAIAGNEVVLAEKAVDAARALIESLESSAKAAQATVDARKELLGYLNVTAPFDGVITERRAHPGALASPDTAAMLRLEQVSRLRLIVPLPESEVSSVAQGARVAFVVPAYPGQTFSGTVARLPRIINPKTRTMPVELDVFNAAGRLAPGMYAEATWPVRAAHSSLFVPPTAIVTTTERRFVIRAAGGKAEWVEVVRGVTDGDLVEVHGNLRPGDRVVRRASDEIRDGSALQTRR